MKKLQSKLKTIFSSISLLIILIILVNQWISQTREISTSTIILQTLSSQDKANSPSFDGHRGNWESTSAAVTEFLLAPSTLRWTHWPALHLWALSAHYDDRPTLGTPPVVRVIAFHRVRPRASHTTHLLSSFSHMYCVHLDRGRRRVLHRSRVNVEDSVAHVLAVRTRWAVLVLVCPLPGAHVRPQYVVLSAHPFTQTQHNESGNSNGSDTRVRVAPGNALRGTELRSLPRAFVRYPSKPRLRQNFAQCVLGALVRDSLDALEPVRLVEWAELSRALGLSALHLYLYSTTQDSSGRPESGLAHRTRHVLRVLQHYAADIVHVHRVEPLLIPIVLERPANDSFARNSRKSSRRAEALLNRRALAMATLQHCLYENLYAYDKLLVCSRRELLVPHQPEDRTLLELVRRLEREPHLRPHAHRNYVFHSAEFYQEKSTAVNAHEPAAEFASQTHLQRLPVNAEQLRPRSLVDAQACVALNAERCTRLTRHANRAGHTVTAPYAIGLVHRYQRAAEANSTCELQHIFRAPGICGTASGFGRHDGTALKFRASFVERALAILRQLRVLRT